MRQSAKAERLRAEIDAQRARLRAKNDEVTKKAGRNLIYAISTGLVFGGIVIVAFWVFPPLMPVLGLLLVVFCCLELVGAMRAFGLRVPRVPISIAGAALVFASWFGGALALMWGLAVASFVLTVWRLAETVSVKYRASYKIIMRDVFTGLFVLGYIGIPISMGLIMARAEHGTWWVFTCVLTVICVDVGAYVSGVKFGRHKMVPKISPNKTWEGFIGAGICGLFSACALTVLFLGQPLWIGAVIGIVVLILATVGDLGESLIKRNLGIKDMSGFLPGHGGLLDRLDSILPSLIGVYGVALLVGVIK